MSAMTATDVLLWLVNAAIAIGIPVAISKDHKADASVLVMLCQCLVAFPVFSVMTIRASEDTPFRPGIAKTLEEEFAVYGYPSWFFKIIRVVKSSFAVLLVVGLVWTPALVVGAAGILVLMVGAVFSHIKVRDAVQKSVPSFTLGCMCASMLWAHSQIADLHQHGDAANALSAFTTEEARWFFFAAMSAVLTSLLASMVGMQDGLFWLFNFGLAGATVYAAYSGRTEEACGLVVLCQCLVAFPVFSVMTIRASQETPFRPGDAKTLEEEFAVYGYPSWFCKIFRIVKSSLAVMLVLGLVWTPGLVAGAGGILVLMIGAVGSHIKVRDAAKKSVPSFTLGCMCASMLVAYKFGCVSVTQKDVPPAVFATEIARHAARLTMGVIFLAMVLQTLRSAMGSSKTAAREPLLAVCRI